jgi:flagellar motor switch protein FliM
MFPGDEEEPTPNDVELGGATEALEAPFVPSDNDEFSDLLVDKDLPEISEVPASAVARDDGDQLSAAELAALADAFATPEDEARSSSEIRSEQEPVVLRYDLVGSTGGQRHDFPALDLIHQSFTLNLGTKLERETRREGAFVSNQPEILNFSEIYATLPMPTGVFVVEVSGLSCTGLILVEPGLLVHLIDLLMGGQGRGTQSPELFAARTFTGTERLIIRRIVEFIDLSLRIAWSEFCPVSIRLIRAEVDPRHAAVFGPGDRVCEFRMDIEWDDVVGDVRFILPMEALRPFEKRLALTTVTPKSSSDAGWQAEMREALFDVPVALKANLGEAELTVRQLLDLKEGDYLRLNRDPESLLDMFVEDLPLFAVKPSVQQGNVAAVLVERITRQKDAEDAPPPSTDEDDTGGTPAEPAASQE